MVSQEIFNQLNMNYEGRGGMAQVDLQNNGVEVEDIEDGRDDVIRHEKYFGDDGGYVEEIIISYDHSRTYEIRPDSNHIDLILYDSQGNQVNSNHIVAYDDM